MSNSGWSRYLRFWGENPRTDVDDEIAFHLEQLVGYYIANGMAPERARELAERRFGDANEIASAMRVLAQQRERHMQRSQWIESLGRDLRYAARQLKQRPGFTLVALLVLALGIGATTAVFSAVDAVLLHPVDTRDVDRLMVVQTNLPKLPLIGYPVGPGEALDIMARNDLYEASGTWAERGGVITELGAPRWVTVTRTMGRFFDVFGVLPAAGRFYRPDESQPGSDHVAVLSYSLSQELGGGQALLGKSLVLNGDRYAVIGITPRAFEYPHGAQVYLPTTITPQLKQNRGQLIWNVVGRIKSGLTVAQFTAGIKNEEQRWHKDMKGYEQMHQYLSVVPLVTMIAGELRPVLIALLCAVGFVLLIACANIASLQLVHNAGRSARVGGSHGAGCGARNDRAPTPRGEPCPRRLPAVGVGIALGTGILRVLELSAGASQLPALDQRHAQRDGLGSEYGGDGRRRNPLWASPPTFLESRASDFEARRCCDGARGAHRSARGYNRLLQTSVVVQSRLRSCCSSALG